MSLQLRDYQENCVRAVFDEWTRVKSTLVVVPTGGGKTIIFAAVIKHSHPKRAMVIAHREELIFQAVDKIQRTTGLGCEIEMASQVAATSLFNRTDVVVATVQTLCSANGTRMQRFNPDDFGTLIIDECFPAGTLVDGRPIETISAEETVRSFNHSTNQIENKKVVRTFKNQANLLVRVHLKNGNQIHCTPAHPIFTQRGYVPAWSMNDQDIIFLSNESKPLADERLRGVRKTIPSQERTVRNIVSDLLFKGMQDGRLVIQAKARPRELSLVQARSRSGGIDGIISGSKGETVLLQTLLELILQKAKGGRVSEDKQEICFGKDEAKQSNEPAGDSCENGCFHEREDILGKGREWPNYATAGSFSQSNWTSNGICNFNGSSLRKVSIPSELPQGRPRGPIKNACRGGRRENSQAEKMEVPRSKENRNFECVGVDRIEILERGSGSEFESVCRDGFVYNLEVESNNNYFAEGILVHNCHHAVSKSYKKVIEHFTKNPELRVIGVTATPKRYDQQALKQCFESVAFDYEIENAIDEGWLVPFEQQLIRVKGLDFTDCRTVAGDFNGGDLARVMESEKTLHGMVQPSLEAIFGLEQKALNAVPVEGWREFLLSKGNAARTIAFTASVLQAKMLSEIFNRHLGKRCEWVCGETPKEERRNILKSFGAGETQIICNCGIFTEGFDDPRVEVIIMGRPTKSPALYQQMAGRALRPLPGIVDGPQNPDDRRAAIASSEKPSAKIVDFTGNCGKHKLMTTADILGGKVPEEVKIRAKRNLETDGKLKNIQQALKEAESELKEEKEKREREERERRAKLRARVDYTSRRVNPFSHSDADPGKATISREGRAFSERQAKILREGYVDPAKVSYAQGQAIIGKLMAVPSPGQHRVMARAGYTEAEIKGFNRKTASIEIDRLAKNHWKKPPSAIAQINSEVKRTNNGHSDDPPLEIYDNQPSSNEYWEAKP